MSRLNAIQSRVMLAVVGGLLLAWGLVIALLRKDWIENVSGLDPDGGNGLVELALVLIPTVVGLGLCLVAAIPSFNAWRRRWRGWRIERGQ